MQPHPETVASPCQCRAEIIKSNITMSILIISIALSVYTLARLSYQIHQERKAEQAYVKTYSDILGVNSTITL